MSLTFWVQTSFYKSLLKFLRSGRRYPTLQGGSYGRQGTNLWWSRLLGELQDLRCNPDTLFFNCLSSRSWVLARLSHCPLTFNCIFTIFKSSFHIFGPPTQTPALDRSETHTDMYKAVETEHQIDKQKSFCWSSSNISVYLPKLHIHTKVT